MLVSIPLSPGVQITESMQHLSTITTLVGSIVKYCNCKLLKGKKRQFFSKEYLLQ